ncbi:FAD-dependent monooxygenase [Streptomyces sp. NPDC051921]|uniref:FAD-dependent monooxygenase n=1 Tax=Streptomyces sp. NPDC051921 TaxID=3155806 RepID=UPI003419A9C5
MFPEHTTVLVVGGGPVGLLLAGELALQNVDVLVLEQHERIRDTPRAGTLHARSVQSLLRRGVLRLPVPGRLDLRQRTGFHFAGLPLLTITSPTAEGPPIFNRPQSSLEQAFEVRARTLGAEVRRGLGVRRLTERADLVEVEVVGTDGTARTLTADWVVGCDGARSTVRERAGFPVTTTEPSFSGVIGLVELIDPADAPGGWARGPEGSTLINVNPRGYSRVLTHDFTRPFPDRSRPVTLEELSTTAARVLGRELPMRDLVYASRFSDFTRVADRYRSPGHGRVLLAGDAAHVHAPLGGQGLNTGLQDAFNLGWKLGLVARGDAPAELLDTYTDERRAVARTVVANTRAQAALMDPRPQQEPLRAYFGRLMEVPEARAATADEISGQGIRHPRPGADPLTGTFLPNHTFLTPRGPRSTAELLEDATPLLLLAEDVTTVPGELLDGWPPDRLRTVRVARADADGAALGWRAVLCRPDGYLAWAAGDTEPDPAELTVELARWLGPARSPAGARRG